MVDAWLPYRVQRTTSEDECLPRCVLMRHLLTGTFFTSDAFLP
jgi:hypothetical protein